MNATDAATLRESVRIEAIIGRDFELTGKGRYLRAKEHDSLIVDCKAQLFNYNSLGVHGDVFTWLETQHHMTFPEAVQALQSGVFGACVPTNRSRLPDPPPPAALAQDLHLRFHRQLDTAAREWWHGQGITDGSIDRFFLGVCQHDFWGLAYTIPVIEAGTLRTIRLRLANPQRPADKYRPWDSGRGAWLYNADILTPECQGVALVAGEKKVIVLDQYGIPAISSTAGCGHWPDAWTTRLQFCRRVYVAFDPTENEAAAKVRAKIGDKAVVLTLPDKPDDFILAHGIKAFRDVLRRTAPERKRVMVQI